MKDVNDIKKESPKDQPLAKEEILRLAKDGDRSYDEREEMIDLRSGDLACLIGMTVCSMLAAIKAFVLKTNPYDLFTVQFITFTINYYYNYKKLDKKRYIIGAVIMGILSIFSFVSFLFLSFAEPRTKVNKNDSVSDVM